MYWNNFLPLTSKGNDSSSTVGHADVYLFLHFDAILLPEVGHQITSRCSRQSVLALNTMLIFKEYTSNFNLDNNDAICGSYF